MHGRTSVLAVLPLPRHRESATADLTTSHRALGDPILLIEGAWKYTCVISTGAVAVFVRVSRRLEPERPARRTGARRRARAFHASYRRYYAVPWYRTILLVGSNTLLFRGRGWFLPALGSAV